MTAEYIHVTEVAGEEISHEQLSRLTARYCWAASYCHGKDVAEVACGTGPGLGLIRSVAKSLRAGDISFEILEIARRHYGERVPLEVIDAMALPYQAGSLDVVVLFEAIYYLPEVGRFLAESRRVLREGGYVLVASANKDLYDFQPSPFSHAYYGVAELTSLFEQAGFSVTFFGGTSVKAVTAIQSVLRPVKSVAVRMGLMPRTMRGKKLIKRLIFGRLIPMPAEVSADTCSYELPIPLPKGVPNRDFKVILCSAQLRGSK